MKILVACEESQAVTIELRKLGHEAYSCDILDESGGYPEWHIKGDAIKEAYSGKYGVLIGFPPCTYLTVTGNRWNNIERYGDKARQRLKDRELGAEFFMKLVNAPIKKIAIENPIGLMSTRYRKPDQIIHPWMFGDEFSKSTCLWLKNLPLLYHNDKPNLFDSEVTHVGKGEFVTFDSGKRMAKWYAEARGDGHTRSKTFPGIAKAMAEQWTENLIK